MKLAYVLLVTLPLTATAAPFLVCDPYPNTGTQPDQFQLVIDSGAPVTSGAVTNADGSKQLKFDLGPLNLSNGVHPISVQAVKLPSGTELGASSTAAGVQVKKSVPAIPAGLNVQ
jgi:hypothetical protein